VEVVGEGGGANSLLCTILRFYRLTLPCTIVKGDGQRSKIKIKIRCKEWVIKNEH
jgi:hypothetical protein